MYCKSATHARGRFYFGGILSHACSALIVICISRSGWAENAENAEYATPAGNAEVEADFKPQVPQLGRDAHVEMSWAEAEKIDLIWVEPGRFRMGSRRGERNERPVRRLHITRGFWIGRTPVTQAQYQALTGANPSCFPGGSRPVERISWLDATAFCELLTERERRERRLPVGYVYRLPTEAEWEFAARGGVKSQGFKYAGSNDIDDVAWHSGNSNQQTHPVAQKAPNELGLYDMSGNVWEWCVDWYQENYRGLPNRDPYGPETGTARVRRGGEWLSLPSHCRVSFRTYWSGSTALHNLGFRIVLAPKIDHD